MIGHHRSNSPARKHRLAAMMNMKLKHVFLLSISFCVLVYFIDQYYSIAPETIDVSAVSDDEAIKQTRPQKSQQKPVVADNPARAKNNASASKPIDQDAQSNQSSHSVPQNPQPKAEAQRAVNIVEPDSSSKTDSQPNPPAGIHVVMVLKDAATNPNLQRKFDITIASIFRHTR